MSDLRASLLQGLTTASAWGTGANTTAASADQKQQPLWRTHVLAIKCLVQLDCRKNPVTQYLIAQQQAILSELHARQASFQNHFRLAMPKNGEPRAVLAAEHDVAESSSAVAALAHEQVCRQIMQIHASPCLESLSRTFSVGLAAWCDAAANLMPFSGIHEAERSPGAGHQHRQTEKRERRWAR